jgi:hypothetical protein
MNILNTVEREAFNSPPVFSSFQRKQYFDFPAKLPRFAAGLRNPEKPKMRLSHWAPSGRAQPRGSATELRGSPGYY